MAKIFITGSADGLGQLAAKALIAQGHKVVLHARNTKRGKEALDKVPGAQTIVTADLSSIEETKRLGEEVNSLGTFDAVIHNAGLYRASPEDMFAVNTLAPYILTCLIRKPKRVTYLSSDMQESGSSKLDSFKTNVGRISYSDTKLHVLMLCKAVARKWSNVYSNAVAGSII
jgi:NAD(P)-dependent dehydrogenase (short-subunit alcohol dehydrogenase family)